MHICFKGVIAQTFLNILESYIFSNCEVLCHFISFSKKDYIFFSHLSEEQGHKTFMQKFEVEPILDLKMRLGEGTGAALAMSLIEAAVKIYNEMATFSSANVSEKDNA